MGRACSFLLVLFLILTTFGLADNPQSETEELPIGFTAEELTRLDEIGLTHEVTSPPPAGDIYNCSEWDPSQGVIIRYPFGISYSIIAELSEDVIVYTIVSSTSQQTTVTNYYNSNGVNMANVEFIIAPSDSYWTRDYGPWFIFDGNGDFGLVDPVYNRPRPDDDAVPIAVGAYLGCPVYGMNLSTPGGNYMSDGLNRAISTTLIQTENPGLTQTQIDSIINVYLGNDYITYPDPLGEYIEHIDCWGKFLNPQTIMVLEVPSYHSQYDELNAAADYLATQISSWGQPYNIVRVLSSGSEAYTNSLILNNKVFVPISNTSNDAAALATYQAAMPGYEILGFTGSWYNTDALHCRTMGVPDSAMLFIVHTPIFMVNDTENDYQLEAKIIDHSNTGLISDSLKVYYRIDDGEWTYSMLTPAKGEHMYQGSIPAQPYGTNVDYYIKAADNSGRVETHPYIGEPGAHTFDVVNAVPQIALSQTQFDFQAYDNETDPIYGYVDITNAGMLTLNWTATTDAVWLDVTPENGTAPTQMQIIVDPSILPIGTWTGNVTVSAPDAENSPQYIEVNITIDPEVPTVIATSPQNNETGVNIHSDITVTFSIDMDPSTITADNFTITPGGSVYYDASVSYDQPSHTATLDIEGELSKSENVFVTVSDQITSTQDEPLAGPYTFDFQTEINNAPGQAQCMYPLQLAENVSVATDLCWAGSDPDGDSVYYRLYFGDTNPPPSVETGYPDTVYTPAQLDFNTMYYWQVITYDGYTFTSSPLWRFTTELDYICGDANKSSSVNVSDAVFIINYVFSGGNPPDPLASGDANCSGSVNVSDAVYIINFVFSGGNYPCDTDGNGSPDC